MKAIRILALAVLGTSLAGCSSSPTTGPGTAGTYEIKGTVVSVEAAKSAVTLDHEDIPGVMKAMKMEFEVEKATLVESLKAGDRVQGRLKKTAGGYVITTMEKR